MPKKKQLIAFLLTIVTGLIVEWVKDFPLSRWFARSGLSVWAWLMAPSGVPRWLIATLVLAAVAAAFGFFRRILQAPATLPWEAYRSDTFFGLEWEWRYLSGRFDPHSLRAFCPQCELALRTVDASVYQVVPRTAVVCPECGFRKELEGPFEATQDHIARLIERNVRRGISGVEAA